MLKQLKNNNYKQLKQEIMKNQLVILTALTGVLFTPRFNEDGTPILDKNGDATGFLRVENPSVGDLSFAYSGGLKTGASALVGMSVKNWDRVSKAYGADGKLIYREGATMKGNVVILETTDSALAKKEFYSPKMAGKGENAKPCLLDGAQIYRKTFFDATCKIEDVLVAHNNDLSIKSNIVVASETEAINQ